MESVLIAAVSAVQAYLLGSIDTGILVSKFLYHDDVRKYGSGAAGMTNMLRTFGKKAAALTAFGDVLKGVLAVCIGRWLFTQMPESTTLSPYLAVYLAAIFAIIGHLKPLYFGFKGGKGVATLVGAVLGIHPITVLLCFGIWFIVLMITHYVSLSSMIAGCCFPVFVLLSPKINHSVPLVVFSFVIAALLIWTHRKNIDRLKKGTESKIYIWRPVASRRRNDPDK